MTTTTHQYRPGDLRTSCLGLAPPSAYAHVHVLPTRCSCCFHVLLRCSCCCRTLNMVTVSLSGPLALSLSDAGFVRMQKQIRSRFAPSCWFRGSAACGLWILDFLDRWVSAHWMDGDWVLRFWTEGLWACGVHIVQT